MKILQIGSGLYAWGGIERYVHYLSEGLIERGHDVTVVCPEGSPLDEHFSGKKHYIGLRSQHDFTQLPKYLKLMRREKFDVVNAHYSRDYVMAPVAARMTRQPFVLMTRHVVVPWRSIKVKQYMTMFDHILGVSGAVGRKLVELKVPEPFISVAHAGVPPLDPTESREETRAKLGIPQQQFTVGFFGRLEREKGVNTLIESATKLPSDIGVEIFGDGAAREELEIQAKQAQTQNVTFRGMIPDVRNAMSAVDVVVVPSFWEEAFPYAVLEANSLGKPVVATRTGGLPEMIIHEHTGLLFEKSNAGQLTDHLVRLSQSPKTVQQMGFAARERQRENFTVPKMAERIEAVYETARESLARNKGRALQQKTL